MDCANGKAKSNFGMSFVSGVDDDVAFDDTITLCLVCEEFGTSIESGWSNLEFAVFVICLVEGNR